MCPLHPLVCGSRLAVHACICPHHPLVCGTRLAVHACTCPHHPLVCSSRLAVHACICPHHPQVCGSRLAGHACMHMPSSSFGVRPLFVPHLQDGWTPLGVAAYHEKEEAAKVLIAAGALLTHTIRVGMTVTHHKDTHLRVGMTLTHHITWAHDYMARTLHIGPHDQGRTCTDKKIALLTLPQMLLCRKC